MREWEKRPVQKICSSLPVKGKVLKSDYKIKGSTPIIDQSEAFIAGYVDETPYFDDPPYIVFGDHTRIIKLVDFSFAPGADGIKVLKAKSEVDSRFLACYLDANPVQNLGYSRHFKLLKEQMIPLPPLNEQKRIAEILGGVQQSIDIMQRLRVETQNLKIATLKRVLDGVFENCQPLSEAASVQSGITKGRKIKDNSTLISVPYMAVSNVKAGYLDLSTIKEIDASETEIRRFRLEDGDILLTEGGDPDKLGRGTIWRGEVPQAIHQNHIFRVRINETSVLTSEALMAVLEAQESKTYFLRSAKQTTGISSINKTQLSATPIPLLEESKVEEITDLWRRNEHIIDLYHQKLTLLQELQRSLSARAFAGQL